jgi:uncharacterized RDD family membrane protein YckC
MSELENPYKAPVDVPAIAVQSESEALYVSPEFAGTFGRRVAANLVDTAWTYLLAAMSIIPSMVVLFIVRSPQEAEGALQRLGKGSGLAGVGISLLASFLYFTFAEYVAGATVGKLALGLRVVNEEFRPASFWKIVGRRLAFFIDAMFFGLPAYSSMQKTPYRQRYGDDWAGTYVLRRAGMTSPSARPPWRLFAGLLVGSAIYVGLLTAFNVSSVLG